MNRSKLKSHIEETVSKLMLSDTAQGAVVLGLLNYVKHRGEPGWETDKFIHNITNWLVQENLLTAPTGASYFKSWLKALLNDDPVFNKPYVTLKIGL